MLTSDTECIIRYMLVENEINRSLEIRPHKKKYKLKSSYIFSSNSEGKYEGKVQAIGGINFIKEYKKSYEFSYSTECQYQSKYNSNSKKITKDKNPDNKIKSIEHDLDVAKTDDSSRKDTLESEEIVSQDKLSISSEKPLEAETISHEKSPDLNESGFLVKTEFILEHKLMLENQKKGEKWDQVEKLKKRDRSRQEDKKKREKQREKKRKQRANMTPEEREKKKAYDLKYNKERRKKWMDMSMEEKINFRQQAKIRSRNYRKRQSALKCNRVEDEKVSKPNNFRKLLNKKFSAIMNGKKNA